MADIEIDITSAQQEQPDIDVHPIYGLKGEKGEKGDAGNGISSIIKTSSSGLDDTYTVNYTNGTISNFIVTNGNGIESITKTATEGLVDTYTITFENGTTTLYTVTNGAKGDTGEQGIQGVQGERGDTGATPDITMTASVNNTVGTPSVTVTESGTAEEPVFNLAFSNLKGEQGVSVTGVTLQSTVGLDKTYRMTFSDNTYFDFVVSNGAAGSTEWGGISGVLSNQTDLQSALNGKYDSSNPNGYTSNIGTITGITMNGTSKGTSGVVDLGTVITSHQDISGKADKSVETTQNIETLSSGTIALASDKSIYKIAPAAATTFIFDITNLSLTSSLSYTFELCVNMSTAYALTFPASVTWQDATAPDMSSTGLYFLVFRTIDGGTTWNGNLQGKW